MPFPKHKTYAKLTQNESQNASKIIQSLFNIYIGGSRFPVADTCRGSGDFYLLISLGANLILVLATYSGAHNKKDD